MHLYSGHDFQVDIRAYVTARGLMKSDSLSHKCKMDPMEIVAIVLRDLGHAAIGGYRVEVGDRLVQVLLPLLSSNDETTYTAALNQLIEYVAVQASTRDPEIISSARLTFVEAMHTLSQKFTLKIAS
jgi:transcription elongation factor GreA-like protein